jgi:hypothetical protein
MVTIRGGFETSSVDPTQQTKARKSRKTQNTATSPIILDPSAKGSAAIANDSAAIANDSAAQSPREPSGLPEPHSDRHEHANASVPDDTNGILNADVDAGGKTINAETHEDSATNVSGQDATNNFRAINVAEIIPLSSIEPPLRPSIPGDISRRSNKRGLTLGESPHLSNAQRPAKLRKTERHLVPKKSKSSLQPKRSARNHVTASSVCDGKWLSFPTTSNHRLIIFI